MMPSASDVFQYQYPRPAIAVDCVVFGLDESTQLKVLLIQRKLAPFEGHWALPGGFVHLDESLEDAARRELQEEAGLGEVFLEQLYSFGAVDRDPRERVVTVAYYALVNLKEHAAQAATDAVDAQWFAVNELPSLAFDHQPILHMALHRLRSKIRYEPIGFELLPKKFTFFQLQKLYETVLGQTLDKRNFRKKFLKMELLQELEEFDTSAPHRPPKLHRFDEEKYHELKQKGFSFEI
ncbi:MAG: NUDIX domain-containing protein [Cyanobacteria bacterium P01_E01_bin.6]